MDSVKRVRRRLLVPHRQLAGELQQPGPDPESLGRLEEAMALHKKEERSATGTGENDSSSPRHIKASARAKDRTNQAPADEKRS
jgi:hypothetical protein